MVYSNFTIEEVLKLPLRGQCGNFSKWKDNNSTLIQKFMLLDSVTKSSVSLQVW